MSNDITCPKCGATFGATNPELVNELFREHEQQVHNFKTGKEFYDRFSKSLNDYDKERDSLTPEQMVYILECAKRAAGLEDGDE